MPRGRCSGRLVLVVLGTKYQKNIFLSEQISSTLSEETVMTTMEAAVNQGGAVFPQDSSQRVGRSAPTGHGEVPSAVRQDSSEFRASFLGFSDMLPL